MPDMPAKVSEQRENIERVNAAIREHVIRFIGAHIGEEFHIEELQRYVHDRVQGYVAPASPDRILRDLRQKGVLDYEVVSRSQSLYKALPLVGFEPELPARWFLNNAGE
jgi:hypothetical protein